MSFIASLPAGLHAWLFNSPLAPYRDAFGAHLVDGGYSAQTTQENHHRHYFGVVAAFEFTSFDDIEDQFQTDWTALRSTG